MRYAARALDLAEDAFAFVAALLLVGNVGTVVAEVAYRFFTGRSFVWVIELNENFMVYMPFLAAAWVLRRGGHVTVDLLEPLMRGGVRRVADVFVTLVGAGASALFLYYGAKLTLNAHEKGLTSLSITRIPEWYVLIALPIGGGLLTLEFLRQLGQALQGRRVAGTREGIQLEEGV